MTLAFQNTLKMYNYQIKENTVLVFDRKLRKFLYYLSRYLLYKHNFITSTPLNTIYCKTYISHKTVVLHLYVHLLIFLRVKLFYQNKEIKGIHVDYKSWAHRFKKHKKNLEI